MLGMTKFTSYLLILVLVIGPQLFGCQSKSDQADLAKKGLTLPLAEGDALVMKGLKSYKQSHFEVAEAQFEAALNKPRKEYQTEEVLVLLGNVYQEMRQFDKALLQFQKALETNPQYYTAWVNQGIIYRITKKPDEAERCYKEALKMAPNDPYLLTSLGALSVTKKEYSDAIALLKKSIHLDPTLNVSYGNLAFAYAEMGDIENANQFLDLAVEHGYQNAQALEYKINNAKVKK